MSIDRQLSSGSAIGYVAKRYKFVQIYGSRDRDRTNARKRVEWRKLKLPFRLWNWTSPLTWFRSYLIPKIYKVIVPVGANSWCFILKIHLILCAIVVSDFLPALFACVNWCCLATIQRQNRHKIFLAEQRWRLLPRLFLNSSTVPPVRTFSSSRMAAMVMFSLHHFLTPSFILQAGVKGTLGRLVGIFEVRCHLLPVVFSFYLHSYVILKI